MLSSDRRSGFALPAVLAVTGVVTLIFLVAITALATLTAEAASARARVRFVQKAMTAEAAIAYLAATEPIRSQGFAIGRQRLGNPFGIADPIGGSDLSPIADLRLDGRAYRLNIDGPILVALQDQAGLVNVQRLNDEEYRRFVEQAGVPDAGAARLRARLADYVDPDDLKSLNGAEREDYPSGGPANRFLLRPSEWLSVLDARASVDPGRWRDLRPDLASDPTDTVVNVNTMTARAMQIRFGITESQAQAAIAAREDAPFLSLNDFAAASGAVVVPDVFQLYTFPSGRILFVIRDGRSPWIYRGRMTLTPGGLEQPLWIDQTETMEAPRRAVAETSDAVEFPNTAR